MKKMTIDSVREHPETKQYIVVLKDEDDKQLIIWIGQSEAYAIAGGLNDVEPVRPMSAQLMLSLLHATKSELIEVRIGALKEEIFYAIIKIRRGKETQEIDARPSDALALAALAKCPIYAAEEVIERATGFPPGKIETPISAFTVIDREAMQNIQKERQAALLKLATSLPEIEAQLHKQEQAQARQAQIEEWKQARNAPES